MKLIAMDKMNIRRAAETFQTFGSVFNCYFTFFLMIISDDGASLPDVAKLLFFSQFKGPLLAILA